MANSLVRYLWRFAANLLALFSDFKFQWRRFIYHIYGVKRNTVWLPGLIQLTWVPESIYLTWVPGSIQLTWVPGTINLAWVAGSIPSTYTLPRFELLILLLFRGIYLILIIVYSMLHWKNLDVRLVMILFFFKNEKMEATSLF